MYLSNVLNNYLNIAVKIRSESESEVNMVIIMLRMQLPDTEKELKNT